MNDLNSARRTPFRLPLWLGFLGFVAVALFLFVGFLLQWPTLPTLLMFPILLAVYVRLARREEREAAARFGEAWVAYALATPGGIPRIRLAQFGPGHDRGPLSQRSARPGHPRCREQRHRGRRDRDPLPRRPGLASANEVAAACRPSCDRFGHDVSSAVTMEREVDVSNQG
jgi:hypothetical protein